MIIVLVPNLSPLRVFSATREEVVLMVRGTSETGSYVASLPPGLVGLGFEDAWSALTRDMKTARYFESVQDAISHYETVADGLSLQQQSRIRDALKRL